jgi:SAM-dependent methyltransferase
MARPACRRDEQAARPSPGASRPSTEGRRVTRKPSQSAQSVEQNAAFFAGNTTYADNVARLKTYRNIRQALDGAIAGKRRLLDVGNGGVFDYDTELVGAIVAVDLFLDDRSPGGEAPANVTFRNGDALDLPEPDGAYDGVLVVSVLHHLVAGDVAGTIENMRRAIAEARRVLEPGGTLTVMESCVPPWAYAVEQRLFGALRTFAATRFMTHPATLQLPPRAICDLLRERFSHVEVRRIPVGGLILQFGRRWPTALTPARPYLFTAR